MGKLSAGVWERLVRVLSHGHHGRSSLGTQPQSGLHRALPSEDWVLLALPQIETHGPQKSQMGVGWGGTSPRPTSLSSTTQTFPLAGVSPTGLCATCPPKDGKWIFSF